MSELHWSRPELWPYLMLAPLLWWVVWQALRAGTRGGAVYGAPLRERVPSAAGHATLWTVSGALLWLTWMEPLLGEEKIAVERRGLDVIFCVVLVVWGWQFFAAREVAASLETTGDCPDAQACSSSAWN